MAKMSKYTTLKDTWLYGTYYDAGAVVELTDKGAEYPLMTGVVEAYKMPLAPKQGTKPAAKKKVDAE